MVRKPLANLLIRSATADDAAALHDLVVQLARYERLESKCQSSVESLYTELSRPDQVLHAFLAELNGQILGMATYFQTYSTFAARRGLYLEDLYVHDDYRHQGIGTQLLYHLARVARERNYGRIEWTTLLWNTPAIEFYETLGAKPNDAWTTYRLSGEWLERLAASDPNGPISNNRHPAQEQPVAMPR